MGDPPTPSHRLVVRVLRLEEIYVFSSYKGKFREVAETAVVTMAGMPPAERWERLVRWCQQQGS